MTEQERQEIENLPSAGKCEEDDFPIIGDIQTLDQYLKRYWIWENRRFFARAPNYKCKENIVEILKSEGNISDSRFEEIVDSRNYEKSPEISNPLRELEDLSEMLAGKLNSIVGEITLPSGEVVKAWVNIRTNFLITAMSRLFRCMRWHRSSVRKNVRKNKKRRPRRRPRRRPMLHLRA